MMWTSDEYVWNYKCSSVDVIQYQTVQFYIILTYEQVLMICQGFNA